MVQSAKLISLCTWFVQQLYDNSIKKITTFVIQKLNCNKMRSNEAEFKEELKQRWGKCA